MSRRRLGIVVVVVAIVSRTCPARDSRAEANPVHLLRASDSSVVARTVVVITFKVSRTKIPPRSAPTPALSVVEAWRDVNGTRIPAMIYGTAYKRHGTADLVERALRAGFVGVDTATAEGKRYNDSGVGEALLRVFAATPRRDYYVQLKVHHVRPGYNEREKVAEGETALRVKRSVAHGLQNLNLEYVDALLLRGPSGEALRTGKLSAEDIEAWGAMGEIVKSGRAKHLGVCNFGPSLVEQLLALGGSRPVVLQARCHAATGWSRQMRDYCTRHGIVYQAPSLVTDNRAALQRGGAAHQIAFARRATVERVLVRFALQLGIVPVLGPSSQRHVRDDVDAFDLELTQKEVAAIERDALAKKIKADHHHVSSTTKKNKEMAASSRPKGADSNEGPASPFGTD
ncbi:hypothetical protein CTAYLR_005303 [Chrysophaeum taylorii]|uniref:NADP-dependent oxidoreductase domain-containing protein n=1 Tax=Chrysophaeum taylorii TaxID=2483200 RepID=A0AAD7XLB6_9STRA|nr:hypothetical protein CTAYLR_005303 [Chrysophaeum taylorii]